jgi:hypothetical protein
VRGGEVDDEWKADLHELDVVHLIALATLTHAFEA